MIKLIGTSPIARLHIYTVPAVTVTPLAMGSVQHAIKGSVQHAIKIERTYDNYGNYSQNHEQEFADVEAYLQNITDSGKQLTWLNQIAISPTMYDDEDPLNMNISLYLTIIQGVLPPGIALVSLQSTKGYKILPRLCEDIDSVDENIGPLENQDLAILFDFLANQPALSSIEDMEIHMALLSSLSNEHLHLLTIELLFALESKDDTVLDDLKWSILNSRKDGLGIRRFLRRRKRIGPIPRKQKNQQV